MKKKNQIVPYEEKKLIPAQKGKMNIKKIFLVVAILLVVLLLVVLITNITNPSAKAKRYLENDGYICNKQTCTKDENNNIYTFNFKTLTYNVDTAIYYVNIGQESPSLTIKDDEYVCTFIKDSYTIFTPVDNTFIYNKNCEKYIKKVNSHIKEYKQIITKSGINVNS